MKITIKPKNLEVTPALKTYIDEKINPLEKFVEILNDDNVENGVTPPAEVIIEVEKETDHHRKGNIFNCKIQVILPGKTLLVSSQSDDLRKAIVEARKELRPVFERYKFKLSDKNRKMQELLGEGIKDEEETEEEEIEI